MPETAKQPILYSNCYIYIYVLRGLASVMQIVFGLLLALFWITFQHLWQTVVIRDLTQTPSQKSEIEGKGDPDSHAGKRSYICIYQGRQMCIYIHLYRHVYKKLYVYVHEYKYIYIEMHYTHAYTWGRPFVTWVPVSAARPSRHSQPSQTPTFL